MKRTLIAIAFVLFVSAGVNNLVSHTNRLKLKDVQLKSTTTSLKTLEVKYDKLNVELDEQLQSKEQDAQKIQDLEKQKADLEKQKTELEKQVKAKAEARIAAAQRVNDVATATTRVYAESPPASPTAGCGDNTYANYIYMHESGCRTTALNSIGCYGIGQSCPASKIAHCGADYACQNEWFTNYANSRYGGWAGAYAFWVAHKWW